MGTTRFYIQKHPERCPFIRVVGSTNTNSLETAIKMALEATENGSSES